MSNTSLVPWCHICSDPEYSWVVSLKEFAHPAFEIFSAVGTIGPTFFLAIAMFGFVFQISSLITEKELKLRQVLTSHSLSVTLSFILKGELTFVHCGLLLFFLMEYLHYRQ